MEFAELDEEDAFAKASAKWAPKASVRGAAKSRKVQEKKIRSTVDGRSLRVTGRTEQFNFKCLPELKEKVVAIADEDGITIAEWMEGILMEAVAARGK